MRIDDDLAGRQLKVQIIPFKNVTSSKIFLDQSVIGIQLNPAMIKLDLEKMNKVFKKNATLRFEFNVFKNIDYYYYLPNGNDRITLKSNQLSILLRKKFLNKLLFFQIQIFSILKSIK